VERDQDPISLVVEQRKPITFRNFAPAWVLALVLLPLAAWLVVAAVNDYSNYTAYERASSCPAGAAAGADCLRTVTASVVDGQDQDSDYTLTLQEPGTATQQARLPDSCDGADLYNAAEGAGSVQAQLWHGGLTEVSAGGFTCSLAGSPGAAYAKALGAALMVGPLDVLVLLVCAWSVTRARFGVRPAQVVARIAMGFLVVLLLSVGVGAGLSATGRPDAFAVYLGGGIVVGVFAISGPITLVYHRKQARRRQARRRGLDGASSHRLG
jgi:hypothetical protein